MLFASLHALGLVPGPPPTLQAGFTLGEGLGFIVLMTGLGYVIGKVYGDEFALLPDLAAADDEGARAQADRVLEAIKQQQRSEEVVPLRAHLRSAVRVDKVFDRARIELLLDLIGHFPAKSAGEDRARLEDALSLASTLATTGPEPVRLRVVAGLCKVAPTQRVAVATLAEIGAARPELWTLIHGPLGALARTSKAVQRYLHENAGPGQTWVARARDLHGQELERFRRLAVDYAAGGKRAAIVRPELEQHVRAELDFLAHAAHPSGRFKWLAAHHSALASFYTDRDLEMLFDAADRGADAVQLLLARFALGWADTGGQDDAIKRVLTELGREAREDPAAREALLGVFTELELAGDEASLTPGRRQLKRDTYLALMAAAADNYEVVRMLKTRGIEPGRYGT